MEINEHGKNRQFIYDGGYEYNETVFDELGNPVVFFNMCAYSDYSFMYGNLDGKSDVGKITIEIDSTFYKAFLSLLDDIDELRIESDFSERFMEVNKNDVGEIEITIHLLPGESDGVIDIKNIMYDLRSKSDSNNTDLKKRLNRFFSILSHTFQGTLSDTDKKLEL